MSKRGLGGDDFFDLSFPKKKKTKKPKLEGRKPLNVDPITPQPTVLVNPYSSFLPTGTIPRGSFLPPGLNLECSSVSVLESIRTIDDRPVELPIPQPPVREPTPEVVEVTIERVTGVSPIYEIEASPVPSILSPSMSPGLEVIEQKPKRNQYESQDYRLHITTKLPIVPGQSDVVRVECKGKKSFGKILSAAVLQFCDRYADTAAVSSCYDDKRCILVYQDGAIVVKSWWLPSYLRIPGVADVRTDANLFLIPKEHENDFEERYPEFNYQNPDVTEEPDVLESILMDLDIEEVQEEASNNKEERFSVGVKGADNRKFEIEVTALTTVKWILEQFLKKKALPLTTPARLIFDDDPLDLDAKVGDTELEDEFEIQVMM